MEVLNSTDYDEAGLATVGRNGTMFGDCGSGAIAPALTSFPFEALKTRASQDGRLRSTSPCPISHLLCLALTPASSLVMHGPEKHTTLSLFETTTPTP